MQKIDFNFISKEHLKYIDLTAILKSVAFLDWYNWFLLY